jgi:hypothetical protein
MGTPKSTKFSAMAAMTSLAVGSPANQTSDRYRTARAESRAGKGQQRCLRRCDMAAAQPAWVPWVGLGELAGMIDILRRERLCRGNFQANKAPAALVVSSWLYLGWKNGASEGSQVALLAAPRSDRCIAPIRRQQEDPSGWPRIGGRWRRSDGKLFEIAWIDSL